MRLILRFGLCLLLALPSCRDVVECPAPQTACNGVCVDLASDSVHCGACGATCEGGLTCHDGACVAGCVVDGRFLADGTVEGCSVCDVARSMTALSPRADGASCATGLCIAGACRAGCFIDGVAVEDGAVDATTSCRRCDVATSTTSWTSLADGSACGAGRVCGVGVCTAACFIDGAVVADGTVNPTDACEHCDAATSTTAWVARSEGSACGVGLVCQAGACASGCFIDGAVQLPGAMEAGLCRACVPSISTTTWTPRDDGSACGAGLVCASATCVAACFIDQAIVTAGAVNPQNACEACDPQASTSSWSVRSVGTSCGVGSVCAPSGCVSGCFIAGGVVDAGAVDPTNRCNLCQPDLATTAYSTPPFVTLLRPGSPAAAQGWQVLSQGPATLVDDGGVITLSTTTTGGSTSGMQLLRYALDAGPSFAIRVELEVAAVNTHNQFDAAAAILGRHASFYGDTTDRAQMVFLDSASVGWADDSQSFATPIVDAGTRVYELAVDAGTATFSVDGVPRLTRTNFATNGVIAIGDQTNDLNVDSTLHVRAVSLICQ